MEGQGGNDGISGFFGLLGNTRDLKIAIHVGLVDGSNGLVSPMADSLLFRFWVSLSTVNWKWPVVHLVAHAHRSGKSQAVSSSLQRRVMS